MLGRRAEGDVGVLEYAEEREARLTTQVAPYSSPSRPFARIQVGFSFDR